MMEDIKLVATPKCTHEEHQAFKYCPFTPLQKLRRIFDDCYRFGGTGVAGANMVIEDIITPTVAAATAQAYERGLKATPAEQLKARTEWAKELHSEGKTVREIVEIMGLKSPGSVSWLLKKGRGNDGRGDAR